MGHPQAVLDLGVGRSRVVARRPSLPSLLLVLRRVAVARLDRRLFAAVGLAPGDLLRVDHTEDDGRPPAFREIAEVAEDGRVKLTAPIGGTGLPPSAVAGISRQITFDVFAMPNRQEHGFYLGDGDVLNVKEPAEFTLRFDPPEVAADLIAGGRLQLGLSRGSPEQVIDGWRHCGYAPPEGMTDADMAPLMAFYAEGRSSGGFDRGIEMGLRRLLADPGFVFRFERDPAGTPVGGAYRISDVELASRLSFFLWSSIPDEELLAVAESGQLGTPAVLDRQVRRMLADPKSQALVENFTGQWLSVRSLRTAEPVGYGVNGSFRELMVQLNDTVPHTVNIVTEGNPPGQPIEVALEAGKTVLAVMQPTYRSCRVTVTSL